MIVATAGHVNHGKTALVRALTGVDTDRLPEERRRGLSIELGFAYLPTAGEGVIGFVDVPGHERFLRAMLAGVSGIDAALLVIAADDGPMPQTREHLAILDLLGVARGVVALTKADRVAPARLEAAAAEVRALLAPTALSGAPLFPTAAPAGSGIAPLRAAIEALAAAVPRRSAAGNFRLAIDRRFTLPGIGLVVTGTAFSGRVRRGDRLLLSPPGRAVRVREVRVQGRPAAEGGAGQRCALNIVGVDLDAVRRGDWLLAAEAHAPTLRLDASIRVLATERRPLRHDTPVHVHLGAVDVSGRLAVLRGRAIAPGEAGLVQLTLGREIGALRGDRLVLRDQSARRTIAGGRVLDPFSPARGRARPARIALLEAMAPDDPAEALAGLLELTPGGVDLATFRRAWNLTGAEAASLSDRTAMVAVGGAPAALGFAPRHWQALRAAAVEALAGRHARMPQELGLNELELRRAMAFRVSPEALREALRALLAEGRLARRGTILHLPGHRPRPTPEDAEFWARAEPLLTANGLHPPPVWALAEGLGMEPAAAEAALVRAARLGRVQRVAANRFFAAGAVARLAELAEALAAEAGDDGFTAAAYRDRSGIGRNLTIELLEFFDRAGLTRRTGDRRRLLHPAAEVFGPHAA